MCMGPFRLYGSLKGVWGTLGCVGPLSVYGPFGAFGTLKGVWGH